MIDPAPFNAYTLLGLEPSFTVDLHILESQYLILSKLHHPDLLPNASSREKLAATQMTASLNKAYGILKDPLARGLHLLSIQAPHLNADQEHTLKDQDLLKEAFLDQETLAEASTPQDLDAFIDRLNNKAAFCLETIGAAFTQDDLETAYKGLYRYRYYAKVLKDATGKRDHDYASAT